MPIQNVFLLVLGLTLLPTIAQARELVDVSVEIATEKKAGEAKQEAFDLATEQATQKLTGELLGPEKMAKYWPGIRTKLLKNSSRYLVFIKGSSPVELNEANSPVTKITVSMRLSPDNLETFLREEGMLNSGTLKVLPLVEIVDSRGAHYVWWADPVEDGKAAAPLEELFKKAYAQMSSKFKSKSAFVIDPTNAGFRMSVPAAYRFASMRREDQVLLAQYLKADVVISGRIETARPRDQNSELVLNYALQVWQSKSGRNLGEIQRSENLASENPRVVQATLEQTGSKVMEELAGKLSEAVSTGNLNLNFVRLAVTGLSSYRQQIEFKRQLAQVREIKVLKDRLFEPNRVTFEVETSLTGQELAKSLQRTQFSLYNVAIDSAQDDSLALSVKALSSSSAQ